MRDSKTLLEAIKEDFSNTQRYYDVSFESDKVRSKKPLDERRDYIELKHRIDELYKNFQRIHASPKYGGVHRIAYAHPQNIPEQIRLSKGDLSSPYTISQSPKVLNDPNILPAELAEWFAYQSFSLRNAIKQTECHVIAGERGVGKTAFLNFLFSTQHNIFDDYKVVWNRIDLTIAQSLEYSLKELSDIHTYDLLCNYYIGGLRSIEKNDYFDDCDYEHVVNENKKRQENLSIDQFKNYLSKLDDINYEENIICSKLLLLSNKEFRNTDIDNKEKMARVPLYRRFLLSKGYSFIYIFDGLDEATIQMQEKEILLGWKQNIQDILQGKQIPKGLYILCARNESFKEIIKHSISEGTGRALRKWLIHSTSISEIIKKRLELFKERIKKRGKTLSIENWEEDAAELLVEYSLMIIKFAFERIQYDGNPLDVFSQSGHMRSVMKFFRDILWETMAIICDEFNAADFWLYKLASFIRKNPQYSASIMDLLRRRSYRVWGIASLNYHNYFDKAVLYDKVKKKILYPGESGELPLIPIIWGDLEVDSLPIHICNHLTTKVRILQLIVSNPQGFFDFNQIIEIISEMFHYSRDNIEVIMKEMLLQRLIDFSPEQDFMMKLDDTKVLITDLGSLIIRKWIYLPEYVEATMNYAVIPGNLIDEFPRFFIKRKMGPLSSVIEDEAMDIPTYLSVLFPSMAKFIALLSAHERSDNYYYKIYERDKKIKYKYDFQIIFDKILINAKQRAEVIIGSAKSKGIIRTLKYLEEIYGISQ